MDFKYKKALEFKSLLKSLNWSDERASEELHFSDRHIRNFKSGKVEIPDTIMNALKAKLNAICISDEYRPLWLRIKDFRITNEQARDFFYGLSEDATIELYSPIEEREKSNDERVYLKLLNVYYNRGSMKIDIWVYQNFNNNMDL